MTLNTKRKTILIGNYLPDKQESMRLFTEMFYKSFVCKKYDVEIWNPTVFFGKNSQSTFSGIGKLLAYLDKYLLFPIVLIAKRIWLFFQNTDVQFHICDHSNAPYNIFLPVNRTTITCHDVLAIRGALGFKDSYCESSYTGKILQRWILNSLIRAKKIAFVSSFTKNQFLELRLLKTRLTDSLNKFYPVIYNGLNEKYEIISASASEATFKKYDLNIPGPFLFHVGSDLPRKNRKLLIEVIKVLGDTWNGVMCFAGQDFDTKTYQLIAQYGLKDRIILIKKPSHDLLLALYNRCEAFIFPSLSEGFGWPLIEAQACGAPVITSNLEPMIEVCGSAAIHANPFSPEEFSLAISLLSKNGLRDELVKRGLKNIYRFNNDEIMYAYLSLYQA